MDNLVTPISGARVVVTGAQGFIGAHLVESLVAHDAVVNATSRRMVRGQNERVNWLQVEPSDSRQVPRLFSVTRPEYVFHLSSLADGCRDLDLVAPLLQSELQSTVNILTAAAEQGVTRVVLAGSFEAPENGEPPNSPYAAAKGASRLYAQLFHRLYSVPLVEARIFMAYGPGQPAAKLLPTAVQALMAGAPFHIESPERQLDWIHIADVVDGRLRLAEAPGIVGQRIDIGTGELTAIRETLSILCTLLQSRTRPTFAPYPARGHERVARADTAVTRRALSWLPGIQLREGLGRCLATIPRQ